MNYFIISNSLSIEVVKLNIIAMIKISELEAAAIKITCGCSYTAAYLLNKYVPEGGCGTYVYLLEVYS